jgi:hypothetical protein
MWTSFAGCRTLCASSLTVAAAVLVPSGDWKILVEMRPVGMGGGSWGADAGCGGAVRADGGYGPVEDSLFDDFV